MVEGLGAQKYSHCVGSLAFSSSAAAGQMGLSQKTLRLPMADTEFNISKFGDFFFFFQSDFFFV